ncbi:MAG: thymidine phosphorylase [Planctomycetaceae bacterium]|nr:thymidine phosphorylase [Planctomycetaceae bacterium]
MNATQLIAKKRDGHALTDDEIAWLIEGYVADRVPDYQMSAFAMAVYLRGMTNEETVALTRSMLNSGTILTWNRERPQRERPPRLKGVRYQLRLEGEWPKRVVDKHSTGGIGDKISLILAPLLATYRMRVPMISGRGLGPTGGTLDKLESIPGFRTDLATDEFQQVCNDVGCVISGATADLVPADRKLYALRDVTATVSCIPLITASVMSKKLAEGLDGLVLDVKHGSGAFMKTEEEARRLAESLVNVGNTLGVKTRALLTDMNQPLGRMIGNAVEVNEAIEVMQGGGPDDLRDLTLALGAEAMVAGGPFGTVFSTSRFIENALNGSNVYDMFRRMVAAQGGDLDALRVVAPASEITSTCSGFIQQIDCEALGYAVIELGGGRKVQADTIDHSVGIEMLVRIGDEVEAGQPVARMFANSRGREEAQAMIERAIVFGDEAVEPPVLIGERIT